MKKIKITVSAVVVIAMVTTFLAFKVRSCVIYCADPQDRNFCNHPVSFFSMDDQGKGSIMNQCGSVPQDATCTIVKIYYCI